MSMTAQARSAYTSASLQTATPAQLIHQLCDRLLLDLERGLRAQMKGDRREAGKQYMHAREILMVFQTSPDLADTSAGSSLTVILAYLQRRLGQADVRRDLRAGKEVLIRCRELCDSWKRAVVQASQAG